MTASSFRPASRGVRATRRSLLIGCALGSALALAARADPAGAQAFQATPTTIAGSVTYNRGTPGIETVTIDTPTAIIEWKPNVIGSPILFLPAGNVATFQNGNAPNFVVLNRITAFDPVRFDGTVLGRLQTAGGPVPGGTILFSSPGGIIVGANAVFDVGSLVLTSLNVVDDGAGNFIAPGGGFQFNGGDATPSAAIVTEAGSQIIANSAGSYVALVAPVIVHGGSTQVNGSVAYIAGEALQFSVNQGLFDIVVTTGSDNPVPITHSAGAVTGGPASTGGSDNHGIYMVAVPKNQAIEMLLEGSIGFEPAISAAVENGEIVLSAGYDVAGGAIQDSQASALPADIVINGGNFTSDVTGRATTDFRATALNGDLAFAGDLDMRAGAVGALGATGGFDASVGGDLSIRAESRTGLDGRDGVGGEAAVYADAGSSVTVAGDALLDASGLGDFGDGGPAGNGTGGLARVTATGGTIAFAGDLDMRSTGEGAANESIPIQGGTGQGGNVQVQADNGAVTIAGDFSADASGIGSRGNGSVPGIGASGTGGNVIVSALAAGSFAVTGGSSLLAQGTGGTVEGSTANTGGTGQGGSVGVVADGGDVDLGTSSDIDVTGFGGIGPNGGSGTGGIVTVTARNGELELGATSVVRASGEGGDAVFAPGGNGGDGTGGSVTIRAGGGAALSRISGGDLSVFTQGSGGNGAASNGSVQAGAGGDGRGGDVTVVAETGNGSLQLDDVLLQANGRGGNGGGGSGLVPRGTGGDGFGGIVAVGTAVSESGPGSADATFALLDVEAIGFGGTGGTGGAGSGGQVELGAADGTQVAVNGEGAINSDGIGGAGIGAGSQGGAGTGGTARIVSQGTLNLQNFGMTALGIGGAGLFGAAGAGQGGLVEVEADDGTINLAGVLLALADGVGGASNSPAAAAGGTGGTVRVRAQDGGSVFVLTGILSAVGTGGAVAPGAGSPGGLGQGGTIDVAVAGGTIDFGAGSVLDASGNGGTGGTGGAGLGGDISVRAQLGTIDLGDSATLLAVGTGAASTEDRGSGGDGVGGDVEIAALNGSAPSLVGAGALVVSVRGEGGAGAARGAAGAALPMGQGGSGTGGEVDILADGGNSSLAFAGGVGVDADGVGGAGGDGGAGTGGRGGDALAGSIEIGTEFDFPGVGGANLGDLDLSASATGGAGGAGAVGGDGGNATGGEIELQAVRAPVTFGAGLFRADGTGGAGGAGAGQEGAAGTGAGGELRFTLDGTGGGDSVGGGVPGGDLLTGDTIDGSAGGFGASPGGNSAGSWAIDVQGGGMNVGDLDLRAGVDGSPAASPTSTIDLANGSLDIAGIGSFSTAGAIALSASGAGRLTGGDMAFLGDSFTASHVGRGAAAATIDVDNLLVDVDGDFTANEGSRIVASEGIDLLPDGTARISGIVAAPDILIRSSDIEIAVTGTLGDAGTLTTTLQVVGLDGEPPGQVVLGGAAETPGYTLTDAEADRIQSAGLRIEGPVTGNDPDRPADLLVRDLSLDAGRVGRLVLVGAGIVEVAGNLLLANAGAEDGIEIEASQRLQVVTPAGSIRVRDASGLPAGSIDIAAPDIWAASRALIDQLRADPDFAGRDDALLANDGPQEPRGYIEAGDIRLFVGETLFVQNSGTPAQFAGITVLENTLTIVPTGTTPIEVVAFGRRINADGSYVTNDRFFREVEFEQGPQGAGYTDASEFNTCIINTGVCRLGGPRNPGGPDIIEDPVDEPDVFIPLPGEGDELVDTSFAADPLIEEPVTSGADSILWDCDRDEDGDCDGDDDED